MQTDNYYFFLWEDDGQRMEMIQDREEYNVFLKEIDILRDELKRVKGEK